MISSNISKNLYLVFSFFLANKIEEINNIKKGVNNVLFFQNNHISKFTFYFLFKAFSQNDFKQFLSDISKEAEKKGIATNLIKDFKNKTVFIPRVIELDRSQPEFKLTLDQYLKRVVTPTRIKKARKKYNENKDINKISDFLWVQPRFIVALGY